LITATVKGFAGATAKFDYSTGYCCGLKALIISVINAIFTIM
jgi:hypothetical protein